MQTNLLTIEDLLLPFLIIPFDDDAAREYGRLRADLERRGLAIGPHDLQIAAIALIHGLALVTHNTKEFPTVGGLNLEGRQVPP